MQKLTNTLENLSIKTLLTILALVLVFAGLQPLFWASRATAAGQLTSRSLNLSTSQGNTSATWTFTFSVTESTALNGITFQVCDAASGACNAPGSWTNSGSAFGSLTYNGSNQTGWALDNASGYLRIKNNSSSASVTSPVVATFNTVTNPNTTNTSFFVRILTYSGDDYTSQVDNGVVAASTTQSVTVTATIDETLSFCVYTNANCGAGGSSVPLGTLTTSATGSGTSKMDAGTNGAGGYVIVYSGVTLTSGSNTVAACSSGCSSTTNSNQFGLNLVDNATPNVGANISPSSNGTNRRGQPLTNYDTADSYRFVTGESVANSGSSSLGPTDTQTYTVSYIANVSASQAAGAYTTTITYTATATF